MKLIKQIHFVIATTVALTAMFLTSCSNDLEPQAPTRDGEVTTSISVGLPQALQTYANNSALGGLKNLEGKNLMVRYIMEVYPKNSTELAKRMICYKSLTDGNDYIHATFSNIRLVAAEYNFVFWADIVRSTTQIDDAANPDLDELITVKNGVCGNRYLITPSAVEGEILEDEGAKVAYNLGNDHYELTSLQSIQVANACDSHFRPINGEMNDACRNVTAINLCNDAPIGDIELKRPFAKLRVITTDADVLKGQNIDWKKTDVRPTFSSTEIPSTFNVLTNTPSGSISSFTALQATLDEYTAENENDTERTVGVWYYLQPNGNPNVTLNVSVPGLTPFGGTDISVSNVPLVENKLTTIKGKLFSKQKDITLYINDEFDLDDTGNHDIDLNKEASTQEELMRVLSGKSENITYTGIVSKAAGLTLDFTNLTRSEPKYESGNTAVLALNIPNIEEDALITIIGQDNVPQKIILNTGAKCSVRVDASKTKICYEGASYKNLLYNCKIEFGATKPSVDAFYIVDTEENPGNVVIPSNKTTCHRFYLDSDFSLTSQKCDNVKKHEGATCSAFDNLVSWLNSNSGETVWDFVEANK